MGTKRAPESSLMNTVSSLRRRGSAGASLLRAGADSRNRQALGMHGLEQVIDRIHLEGAQRVFVVRRDKDHVRRSADHRHQVETAATAELDVEEHHLVVVAG